MASGVFGPLCIIEKMFTKVYWIEKFENGAALGIMPRPRGNDWLEDEIKLLAQKGVGTVVSLLEQDEIQELGLREEGKTCQKNQMVYLNLPIKDTQLPSDEAAVSKLIQEVKQKIEAGEKVVIHCRMGIGRASIIAGAVLLKKGTNAQQVIEKITKARELKVPDTEEQLLWLKKREG